MSFINFLTGTLGKGRKGQEMYNQFLKMWDFSQVLFHVSFILLLSLTPNNKGFYWVDF